MDSAGLHSAGGVFARALTAAVAIALVGAMPRNLTAPALFVMSALIAVGFAIPALIGSVRTRRPAPSPPPRQWIPIHFSGPVGSFRLRRRGDGRHVEIVAPGGQTVAEVRATDEGDEIVLHGAVATTELEHFGAALGQAIEIASEADQAHLDWDWHAPADEDRGSWHAMA